MLFTTKCQFKSCLLHLYQKDSSAKNSSDQDPSNQDFSFSFGEFQKTFGGTFGNFFNKELAKPKNDSYAVLDLNSDASDQEITDAYRKLVLTCHPDKILREGNESELAFAERKDAATQKFVKISAAYKNLTQK